MRITVLGLGEAGSIYAAGLADLGLDVAAFDPLASATPAGVTRVASPGEAVSAADLVLSLVGGSAAEQAAGAALPHLADKAVYADMNTCSPATKEALASSATAHGVLFTDVAILAPVPRAGLRTPLLASGPGSRRFEELLASVGVPITRIDGRAGAAGASASLKLLRSVFMKGLAALLFETLSAAERQGDAEWIRRQIIAELDSGGEQLVERLLAGTRAHAARREREMRDVREHLDSLESPAWMTEATIRWLHEIAGDGDGAPAPPSPRSRPSA
jgi:3-hydroxyisobutyrate dehydrogenase-like beta-hydroxyacid dehydrogenase